jgi:sugar (pentulose or hexulose) kinase
MLETFEKLAGPVERLLVSGGGARSEVARATKRAALGPFERPPVDEAGARGAALIAGTAAGLFADLRELPPPGATRMEARS